MFLFKFLIIIIPALVMVAFCTLMERKILSIIGLRLGPFKVSFVGILQPIADAVKLANKQVNSLYNFSFFFYYISAFFMIFSALMIWSCLFLEPSPLSLKFSILIFFLVLGFNSFNSILAGWSTFSKFSLIGSMRSVSQLISYEAVLYMCVFFFLFFFGSFNFYYFQFMPLKISCIFIPICLYLWLPSMLAELNRTPYDFSESESELVSGFNTEFGSSSFTMIFLAEYSNIIFFSVLSSMMFFFGMFSFFFLFFVVYIIWIRSVLPRYRFDKLMMLAWKLFIPFLTIFLVFFIFFVGV